MLSPAMKTVKTYSNLAEAGFAHSLIEAAGIPAFIADEQSFSLGYPVNAIGIRVQVEEADYERALHVLAEGPDAAAAPADIRPPVPSLAEPPPKRGMWPVGLFIAIAAGAAVLALAMKWRQVQEKTQADRSDARRYEYDNNHDGTFDNFAYYDGDHILRMETDLNFDGRIDDWWYFDRAGVVERQESDTDFDGKPDLFTTFEYGVQRSTDVRPGDSKIVIRRWLFKHGVLNEERVDENADGKFDYRRFFDPFGKESERIPFPPEK